VDPADKAYYDRLLQFHAGKAPNVMSTCREMGMFPTPRPARSHLACLSSQREAGKNPNVVEIISEVL